MDLDTRERRFLCGVWEKWTGKDVKGKKSVQCTNPVSDREGRVLSQFGTVNCRLWRLFDPSCSFPLSFSEAMSADSVLAGA